MNWDDLRFFLAVSRHRTLSAAAQELKVAQPTVGRRISALERRLGAKLFVRSSTGLTLTSSGTRALGFAERMENDALATERELLGRDEGLRGSVRITASEWLITAVLAPLVGPLSERNPQLQIELVADARHLNLARRDADIAIRPRRFEQHSVAQRAVGKLGFGLYATPRYVQLHGLPSFGDGLEHVLIAMSDDTGDAARAWLDSALPRATRSLKTNGRDAMLALARCGVGVARLARVVGDSMAELQRLPMVPAPPTPTLWLGTHRDARSTPRVSAVAAHLTAGLRGLGPRLCPED